MGMCLKQEVREQDFSDKIRYNFLIETLTGIHTTKSQGLEKFFFRRNDYLQNPISTVHFQVALSNNIAMSAGMLLGHIFVNKSQLIVLTVHPHACGEHTPYNQLKL